MNTIDPARFTEPKRSTRAEVDYRVELDDYFARSIGSNVEKLQNFAKYVPVQDQRKYVARYELFKEVMHVHGSIVECGVLFGGGLMTWAGLSEIFEPLNHLRNIIGFDTFNGFVSVAEEDKTAKAAQQKLGGLAIDSYDDLLESVRLYDTNRFLPHIQKVRLVRGDIAETAPRYIEENPHTVIAMLWLDFDTYEPTVHALRHFVPRIPKGGIIAFDEMNHEVWPGETLAVMKEIGLSNLRLKRFPWGPTMSYAVME